MLFHTSHVSHLDVGLKDAITRVVHDAAATAVEVRKHSSNFIILVAVTTGKIIIHTNTRLQVRRSRVTQHMRSALKLQATLAPSLASLKANEPGHAPADQQPPFLYSTMPIQASSKSKIVAIVLTSLESRRGVRRCSSKLNFNTRLSAPGLGWRCARVPGFH